MKGTECDLDRENVSHTVNGNSRLNSTKLLKRWFLFMENPQLKLTHSFLFLALKENGGYSGNPGISLEEPHSP